jgi:hypothetical protein
MDLDREPESTDLLARAPPQPSAARQVEPRKEGPMSKTSHRLMTGTSSRHRRSRPFANRESSGTDGAR